MKKVFTKRALMVLFVLMTFGLMALKANPTEVNNVAFNNNVVNFMSLKITPAPLPTGVNLIITTNEPLESGVASFDTVYYGTVSTNAITYTLQFSGDVTDADRQKIYTFAELSMLMSPSWEGFDKAGQRLFINDFKDVFYKSSSLAGAVTPEYFAMYQQLFAQAWATSGTEGMLFATNGVYDVDTLQYFYVTGAEIEAGVDFTFRYTPSNKNYIIDEAEFIVETPALCDAVTALAYEPDPLKKKVYYYFMGTNGYPAYPSIGDATVSLKGWGKEPFITIDCANLETITLSFDSVYYGHQATIPAVLRAEGLGSRNIISFAELYLLINTKALLLPNANNPFHLTDLVNKFYQATPMATTTAYDQLFTDVLTRNIQQLIPGADVAELYHYYLTKADLEAGVDFDFIYVPPSIHAADTASLVITSQDPQTTPIIASYLSTYPAAYALYNNYPQIKSSEFTDVQDINIMVIGYGKPGVLFMESTPMPLTTEGYYVCDSTYFGYVSDSVEYTIKAIGLEPGKIFSYAEMIVLWADNSMVPAGNFFPSDYINRFDKTAVASPYDLSGDDSVYNVYFQRAFNTAADLIWGSTAGHVYQDLQYYWISAAELEAGISFKVAYTPSAAYKVSSYSPAVIKEAVIDSARMQFVHEAYNASAIQNLLHEFASAYDTAIYEIYANYPVFENVRVATIGNPIESSISLTTDISLDADGYHTFEGVPFGCVSDSITYKIYGNGLETDRNFTYVELAVLMADSSTAILSGDPFPSNYVNKFKKTTPLPITTDLHDFFVGMWEGYETVVTNLLGNSFYESHDKTFADTLAYYYVTGQELLDTIAVKVAYEPLTPNMLDSARMWMLSVDEATAARIVMNFPEPKRTFYRSLYANYPEMHNVFIGTKGIAQPSLLTLTPHDINESGYQYHDFGEVYYGHYAAAERSYEIKSSSVSATCLAQEFSYVELLLLMDSMSWENYTTGDPFPWTNLQTTFKKDVPMSIMKPGHAVLFDTEYLLREAGKRMFGAAFTNAASKVELADTLKYYYVSSDELSLGINIQIGYTPTSTVSVDSAHMVLMDPRDLNEYPIFVANPTVKAIYNDYPIIDSVVIAVRGEGKPPVIKVDPQYQDTTHFGDICIGDTTANVSYDVYGIGFVGNETYTYAEWMPLMSDSSTVLAGNPFPSNYDKKFRYQADGVTLKPELPKYAANQAFYDALFANVWNDAAHNLGLDITDNPDTLKYWYVTGDELLDTISFEIAFKPEEVQYVYAQMGIINPDQSSIIPTDPTDPSYIFYHTNYPVFDNVIIQVDGTGRGINIDELIKVNDTLSPMCISHVYTESEVMRLQVSIDPSVSDGNINYVWSSSDYPYAFTSVDSTIFTLTFQPNVLFVPTTYTFKVIATSGFGCIDSMEISVDVLPIKYDTICENGNYTYQGITIPSDSLLTPKSYTLIGPIQTPDFAKLYSRIENNKPIVTHYFADSLKTVDECDSIYKLYLSAKPTYNQVDSVKACADNATFTWTRPDPDMVFNLAGIPIGYDSVVVYDATLTSGCDSIWTLKLSISEAPTIGNIIGSTHVYSGETQHYAVLDAFNIDEYIWDVPEGWLFLSNDTTDVQSVTLYVTDLAVSGEITVYGRSYGCGETEIMSFHVTVLNEEDASITIIPTSCNVCEYYNFGNVYYQDTALPPAVYIVKGFNLPADKIITYAELLPLMNDNGLVPAGNPFPSNYIQNFEKAVPAWSVIPANYDALFNGVWDVASHNLGITGDYRQLNNYYVTGAELNAGIPIVITYHPSAVGACDSAKMEIEDPKDASLVIGWQTTNPLVYTIYENYPLVHNAKIAVTGCGTNDVPVITITPNDASVAYDFGAVYMPSTSIERTYIISGQNLNPNQYFTYAELAILMADDSYGDDQVFLSNYVEQFRHGQRMPIYPARISFYTELFNQVWNEAAPRLGLDPATDDPMSLAYYYVTGEELMNGIPITVAYRPSSLMEETAKIHIENPESASLVTPELYQKLYAYYPVLENCIIDVKGHDITSYITVTPAATDADPYDFGGVSYG
ncbi:MAG: hypothetical protein PHR53_06085, partial [Bacteroidales bacterium]|nr:hypothetical protein [Bacteroidales bacterium]